MTDTTAAETLGKPSSVKKKLRIRNPFKKKKDSSSVATPATEVTSDYTTTSTPSKNWHPIVEKPIEESPMIDTPNTEEKLVYEPTIPLKERSVDDKRPEEDEQREESSWMMDDDTLDKYLLCGCWGQDSSNPAERDNVPLLGTTRTDLQ
uniref:Uncharacterized protein n=1 Tax=Grammatophora oceanica TaxID=210454 RepID=A0A7S1UQZ9_9STRA|mmetsp:Transcript_18332/g.27210  ORF Transcript_18332/g.27210 Transcript_18332/m.27210 type:complete len:149 (+) Transcript_18332:117-563(+)|eukprot:CAMPEP_0194036108 /NCGR_PEP_ID=MMETSP0009_2-20130614/8489_1 /TAXON_ID=210454 /ORGANISM="Grammatophora oceanica, Strain CCMP 410" /LENGTH=148 /DNA_ID=CAMNT_0038677723 /DNA_START=172 /DNA_END=618 /DNA_ORIENTATION=-